ncbi:hypothetical protein chiPu_0002892 [Chiloscyllium punctatum]|uniref:Uncharacterized protein n=1 Tax=Chiloscyllium punctatum TaxID=137246 RepID=A0A401S250_CHIPU|nr:hypothetical protein [Chiloscyllium punctatum]
MRNMFLVILAIYFCAVDAAPSFSSSGGRTFPHDITSQSELTRLYNTEVIFAERVTKPLNNFGWLGIRHSGVRLQKGKRYGIVQLEIMCEQAVKRIISSLTTATMLQIE